MAPTASRRRISTRPAWNGRLMVPAQARSRESPKLLDGPSMSASLRRSLLRTEAGCLGSRGMTTGQGESRDGGDLASQRGADLLIQRDLVELSRVMRQANCPDPFTALFRRHECLKTLALAAPHGIRIAAAPNQHLTPLPHPQPNSKSREKVGRAGRKKPNGHVTARGTRLYPLSLIDRRSVDQYPKPIRT